MLYGGEGDDYVSGGQGNDVLTDNPDRGAPTNSGNDMFFGGEGRDVLSTGVGDDYLNGGAGADTLDGGEGFDTAGYHAASGAVTVDLLAPGQNTGEAAGDVYVGIEAFQLSGYDDAFIGTNAAETVYGDSGNDTIRGGGGDDRLIADRSGFHSSSGADVLFGEGGNDYLEGGRGADALSGGAGADLFVYRSTLDSVLGTSDSVDVISDFSRGEDRVDLSLVDANGALAGDQAFTFLTNPGGYNGDWSGLVWAKSKGGITTIYASTDADSSPEMQITLTGNHHLTASDFIL
jgi:Ca2+-binding RTX toxin-like protein